MLRETFAQDKLKTQTSSSEETIGGLTFDVFHITIFGPKNEIAFKQKMYGRYVNGYDFGLVMMYNNDKDEEAMMKVWKTSTFKSE